MGRGWPDGRCVEGDDGDVRVDVGWKGNDRRRSEEADGWLGCETSERKTMIVGFGGGSLGGYRSAIGGIGRDVATGYGFKRWVSQVFAWW